MKKFKTESQKLLDLMINAIYTNKEIFLRELISNASDAIDKLYFRSLTDSSIAIDREDLCIRVDYDPIERIVSISDNGIGMGKDDLDRNLGTIAHSDSLDFKTENGEAQGGDIDIIGQFGVGFYSAFMVASNVRVVSRAYGSDEAYEWESDGVAGYTIRESERLSHGTDVYLILKPDTDDEEYSRFASEYELKHLITTYSNYVRYPIQMMVTKQRALPKPADAGDDYKTQYESYKEIETINSMIPIWKRSKSEVEQDEYNGFYKSTFHDYSDPVRTINVRAEGTLTYDALLFIPGRRPFDMYSKDYEKGLALYSSNVLIMEKCADLVPDYFNFVRGVVDSADLTLNISRETLQQNSQLRAIAKKVEKKVKAELVDMRDNDREAYEEFFENFGRSIKFGIYQAYGQNADLLADLLLFYSVKLDKLVTLDEYIEAMPADQKDIFYAAGESKERLSKLPIVTTVASKGYDVLLCTEDVDEFSIKMMGLYNDHALKNVSTDELGIESEEEKKEAESVAEENKTLFDAMKEALDGRVASVAVSTRLTDAPACITTVGGVSLEMERILAQGPDGADDIKTTRVLELNPKHPVFATLAAAQESGDADKVANYADLLYNQALLVEGLPLDDPIAFAQKVADLMK